MKTIIAALALCVTAFGAAIPVSGGGYSTCTQYGESSFRAFWTLSFAGLREDIALVNLYIFGTGYCGPVPTSATTPSGSSDGYATIDDFTSGIFSFGVGGGEGWLTVGRGEEMRSVDLIGWASSSSRYEREGDVQIWTYSVTITPTEPPVPPTPVPEPGGMAAAGLLSLAWLEVCRRIRGRCSAATPEPR